MLDAKGCLAGTHGADLAIAFDGDADRFGMIDSDRHASHSTDRLLIPLVWDILKAAARREYRHRPTSQPSVDRNYQGCWRRASDVEERTFQHQAENESCQCAACPRN